MKNQILNFWFLVLFLSACASPELAVRKPSSGEAPDYPALFKKSRELLIPASKEFKNVPEHYVIGEFQDHPELLAKAKQDLIQEITVHAPKTPDLTKHTRLIPPPGLPGYSDMKLYVNHPYYQNGVLVQPTNLIEVWRKFILSAEKEIILNVFDFDLEEVADALIEQAHRGLYVQVGIDKKSVIDVRAEVKAVSDRLIENGVHVTGVIPVGLNHQKITAIDWSNPKKASVLFSSGNLTRSCLEPQGDLKGTVPLPKESVPNANHFITMKSWLLANLVHHELTKTLSSEYLLRGKAYPLNGSYQITGPGVDPYTYEAYPEPSLTISFTPGGGMKSVNKNMIAHFVKQEKGRIRMLQFAYSSSEVDKALLERAESDYQRTKTFDFLSVGDTPFAMREWSRFLIMSGMKRVEDANKKKTYLADPENEWVKRLGTERVNEIQKKVYIAPKVYGNNWAVVAGKKVKVNAKIHHKILATENYAIMGTSFNFSEGAESNNEQILVFRDRKLSDAVDGMVKYLVEHSPGTVAEEGARRNKFGGDDEAGGDPEDRQVGLKSVR
ncbi:phospholipase D-like domain-containing protein [Peredibacter starrii]|uniref:phospholipase D n=1 Tax=Peredibacter starrii TaxID=28202 RepID=A0AAX4HLK1_9BACT|nr:phospholipase D-like domain-containing protein [Peredibacter starrii]WPU64081.1 phospholipase D-like domain-containing protein [Peredibacter starrii]